MRRLLCCLVVAGCCAAALAAPPSRTPPLEQVAPQVDRAGETEEGEGVFTPLPVPGRAMSFKDPAIAGLAARIASGHADLRERRAWYAMSLLYSPFDALPPTSW